MTIIGASGAAGAAPRPSVTTLRGSVAPFVTRTTATGNAAGSQKLTIQVWLRPRTAAAEAYARSVSTPGSTLFRHYLSPDAWAARFGATPAAASKVAAWLRSTGFTAIHAGSHRSFVRATGKVSQINAAFRTQVKYYRATRSVNAGRYRLRANSRAISVPTSLAGSVLGVTGIDNAAPVNPMLRPTSRPARARTVHAQPKPPSIPCSQYYGQHVIGHLPAAFGTTKFATDVCGYSASQMRAAYGANSVNTGKGQTIALVELGLTRDMFLTLQDYAAANGMPAPSPRRYSELSLGQGTACGDFFDVEEQLDVESSYDMAPGASQLVVGGDSCNDGDFGLQGLFDAVLAVLGNGNHSLATVASNSWGSGDEAQPAFLTDIEHAFLVRGAAEGVGMYFATGDFSGNGAPTTDPFAIGVGGTTLGIGKTNNRLFETGWSTDEALLDKGRWFDVGEQGAASGGPSLLFKEPAYQKGVVPAALTKAPGDRGGPVRSAPDISADADPFTGFATGLLLFHKKKPPTFAEFAIGGTSLATPLVAGIVTAAQQGQGKAFGFVNPVLYKLGHSAYIDALPLTKSSPTLWRGTACSQHDCGLTALATFDVQSFNMFGYFGQVTLRGYDNMTGIGVPAGQAFISALRKAER